MILLTSICAVFAFGVGAGIGLSLILGVNTPGIDTSDVVVLGNIDVPEAERALDKCIDTAKGCMQVNYVIPDKLPLCITEEYVDNNFALTVISYGGYTPDLSGCQCLNLLQVKTGKGGVLTITWDEGTPVICPETGCAGMKYTASFDIANADVIMIDSNHLPIVKTTGVDWAWLCDGIPSDDLDKWVTITACTAWEGCHKEDQKFTLILVHKRYFQAP